MKRYLVLFLCVLLFFIVACSQNSGKKKAQNVPIASTVHDRQGVAANSGETERKCMLIELSANRDGMDSSILELYEGISIRVTNRKTQLFQDAFIPFMTLTKLEGTPLTMIVTGFSPDFIMTGSGYATCSYEPINPGARVKITGVMPEFEGWMFVNFPNIHPYDNPDYYVVMTGAVKK